MRRSLILRCLAFCFCLQLTTARWVLAVSPFSQEVDAVLRLLASIDDQELDQMSRQTVQDCIASFAQGVDLIQRISRSELTPDEKRKLQLELGKGLGKFFVELSAPYANVSAEPEELSVYTQQARTKWEYADGVRKWLVQHFLFLSENVFRDVSRFVVPGRRDIHGEFQWSVPPVFPHWGNDWARSDATDPMVKSILDKLQALTKDKTAFTEEELSELIGYALVLQEMAHAEPMRFGPRNAFVRKFEAIFGIVQNIHPLDIFGLLAMGDDNSTWVSGIFMTGAFLLTAKSRLENSGLKSYWHWSRATRMINGVLPDDCRQLLSEASVTNDGAISPRSKKKRVAVGE